MLEKIISASKNENEEKVGFSLQLPKSLKNDFDQYCKKNETNMTATLISFMRYAVNVDKGMEYPCGLPSFAKSFIFDMLTKAKSDNIDSIKELEAIAIPEDEKEKAVKKLENNIKLIDDTIKYVQ